MSKATDDASWQQWFERVWAHRDEEVYPSLFGRESKGIYTITPEILKNTFKQESIDPRWLHYGVFQFAPTDQRRSWLYVTSGMSNPWESESPESSGISGLGCEFILETTAESEWAILRLLHVMAFQVLLAHGRYPGREILARFDRLPLKAPIIGDSKLTWVMVAPPIGVPATVQLESGSFEFLHVVAVTESEAAYARTAGGPGLLTLLSDSGFYPVINPSRDGIILPKI